MTTVLGSAVKQTIWTQNHIALPNVTGFLPLFPHLLNKDNSILLMFLQRLSQLLMC